MRIPVFGMALQHPGCPGGRFLGTLSGEELPDCAVRVGRVGPSPNPWAEAHSCLSSGSGNFLLEQSQDRTWCFVNSFSSGTSQVPQKKGLSMWCCGSLTPVWTLQMWILLFCNYFYSLGIIKITTFPDSEAVADFSMAEGEVSRTGPLGLPKP